MNYLTSILHQRLLFEVSLAEKELLLSLHSVCHHQKQYIAIHCCEETLQCNTLRSSDFVYMIYVISWRQYISGRKLYDTISLANTADLVPRLTCSMEQ